MGARVDIQIVAFLLEPSDVVLDIGTGLRDGTTQAVLLGSHHGQHLPAARHQRGQGLGVGIPQGAHGWTNCLAEVGQYLSVQAVGLGQLAGGLGEIAHLPGVDHRYRQRRRGQSCHQGCFQAADRLQYHRGRLHFLELSDQRRNRIVFVVDAPGAAGWSHGDVRPGFGHTNAHVHARVVDAHVVGLLFHIYLRYPAGPA